MNTREEELEALKILNELIDKQEEIIANANSLKVEYFIKQYRLEQKLNIGEKK